MSADRPIQEVREIWFVFGFIAGANIANLIHWAIR